MDNLTLKLSKLSNIEIIFINDFPGENQKLKTYNKNYENVYLIENDTNIGAGKSRNKAIPIIEGKYTYFFDADDSINIELFLKELDILKKNNYDILHFKFTVNRVKNKIFEFRYKNFDKHIINKISLFPWWFIVKTSIIHNNSIFFGVTNIHNDLNYTLLSVYYADTQYLSNNYIYNYTRKNNGSLCCLKDRVNCIHSLYYTYLKLKEINYDSIEQFNDVVNSIVSANIMIDQKNKTKILEFKKLYFI